jgi:hypothetical protein
MAVKKSKAELAKKIASKVKAKAKTKKTKAPSYVKQGQSAPQSKAWTEPSDKQEKAKPVGVRWTDDGARKAGKNPNVRPTKADIEKYSGKTFRGKLAGKDGKVDRRYIYGENRVDKSDFNRKNSFARGGNTNPIEKLRIKSITVDVHEDNYENGEGKYVNGYGMKEYANKTLSASDIMDFFENELYLSGDKKDYVVMDNTIRFDRLVNEDSQELTPSEYGNWMIGKIKAYNEHWIISFDLIVDKPITEEELSRMTGISSYKYGGMMAKGGKTRVGFSGRQSPNYDKVLDGDKLGKPVGVRWTTDGAERLGKNPHSRPTKADVEKYAGKTFRGKLAGKDGKVDRHYIYTESRQDKADMKPSRKFISLKSGGKTTYRPQYVPNSRIKSITLDNGRVIPNENIYDGAYVSKSLKLVDGGIMMTGGEADGSYVSMYARGGGVKKISNVESSSYSENLLPFKGANLEGKLLDNGDYVVLSYGYYPIWWYCKSEGKWYGNSTKYSVTTSKQMSQSRPSWDATMVSRDELEKKMMSHSAKYEVGGVLSGLPASSLQGVGGTTFSTTDLTPNLDINAQ